MGNRPVTIRTLDLGGDKLPIGHRSHEANPALGLRAIRLTLRHPALFRTQARAFWRASVSGNLRILLPMISFITELREAKVQLAVARAELVSEGIPVAESLPIGIMVETPAAALCADRLARECDFFSIGTNDLIQYTLAIDRQNRDVSSLYQPLHLGVLRLLKSCIEGARASGIEVAMCGEMAGDPAYALVLLALGLDTLSMSPADLPKVKRVLRGATLADAKAMLDAAMSFGSSEEISASCTRRWSAASPSWGTRGGGARAAPDASRPLRPPLDARSALRRKRARPDLAGPGLTFHLCERIFPRFFLPRRQNGATTKGSQDAASRFALHLRVRHRRPPRQDLPIRSPTPILDAIIKQGPEGPRRAWRPA